MRLHRRLAATIAACALAIGAVVAGNIATATPNQFLDRANGHSTLDNGKPIAHPSGGTEVSFDDERALGADVQSTAASWSQSTSIRLGSCPWGSSPSGIWRWRCCLPIRSRRGVNAWRSL